MHTINLASSSYILQTIFHTHTSKSCIQYILRLSPHRAKFISAIKISKYSQISKNISCGYKILRQKFCRVMAGHRAKIGQKSGHTVSPPSYLTISANQRESANQSESANHESARINKNHRITKECASRSSIVGHRSWVIDQCE